MSSSPGTGATPVTTRRIASFDGTALSFDLYPSASPLAILLVPGFWRTRRYPSLRTIGHRVARSIGPCAIMDCRGHGESGGVFEFNRNEHHDVAAVSRALLEETGADQLVFLGLSAGGAIAVSAAAQHRELPLAGLVLVSPVCDFRRVIPRPNPFTLHRHISVGQAMAPPRFRWPGDSRRSPIDDVKEVVTPICLIHARNDWLVAHHHSEELGRGARSAEIHILDIPGRYHADKLFDVAPTLVWSLVDDFVRRVKAR